MDFQEILHKQKDFFLSGQTKSLDFRKKQLMKLRTLIKKEEKALYAAVYKDFQKSEFDTFTTELALILDDIRFYLKNLKKLTSPKRAKTNIVNQPARSKIYYEPLGNTLVIGAWNYPYLLSLSPAIAAIAAGNTVLLKPSEVAVQSARAIANLINSHFPNEVFYVVEGGVEVSIELLKLKYDKIFFTGSTRVGKIVYQAAAKNLTPVTLELGGKSPVIVTPSANLKVAAKRIVWGKFINAGQTCVAPDYLLVNKKIKEEFFHLLKEEIERASYESKSEHYTQIINESHFERLSKLLDSKKIIFGGGTIPERRYIEPTIMDNIDWEDEVMQEEIFGPILPILEYENYYDAIQTVSKQEKPLSAYLFSNDSVEKDIFTHELSFGGGGINDVVMHLSNPYLPFGGVGDSGMGSYHGKFGFETFSHRKAVLEKSKWGEPDLKYPPYTESKLRWIKKIMGR